ncbi:MAG: hypothetical protein CMJ36_02725 [Phycisphaerae bacterium]|nr:hypothetical protein [Phycisphaerae bacterium]
MIPHRFKFAGLLIVSLCIFQGLSGCNIVTPVAYVMHPEPQVKAEFTLSNVPTVIFLDDRKNRINPTRLRRIIADEATTVIMEEGLVSEQFMIAPRDAMIMARKQDRSGTIISLQKVGELVGAQQLIYVDVDQFALTYDGVTPTPQSISRVKVLDLVTGKRVFPSPDGDNPSDYFTLNVEIPSPSPHGFNTAKVRNELNDELALLTGERLAKLFYSYMESELGSRLDGPG